LLCLLPAPSGAAAAAGEAPRIVAIEIEGARRTRRAAVLQLARVQEGDPWRPGLEAEARQLLLNAGIFYEANVAAETADGGVRLRISLREKWTLVGLPLFVVKDGETTWGATVVESNLLGTASRLVAVLSVREGKPGGTLLYVDPHFRGSRAQLFAALAHTDRRTEIWDAEETTGSYRSRTTGATLALGRRFAARTSLSLGLRLTDFSFDDPQAEAAVPADARERAVSLQLRHEGTDLDEERRTGLYLEARLEQGVAALGDEVGRTAASAVARWARGLSGRSTLGLAGHALVTDTVDYEPGSRPATAFLRGYEEDRFRPDRLLGGSLEVQLPLARFREATFSLVPFADAALLRDGFRSFTLADIQADAGFALAVYVRRVAFPVFQIYGAYGFSTGEVLPGFSLGINF
jgi:outer membrane protein assembly factor BamA